MYGADFEEEIWKVFEGHNHRDDISINWSRPTSNMQGIPFIHK